jgi:NDP-sugar pyrophosphorylase family protein
VPVDDPSRYGIVETDEHGKVRQFVEKPQPEQMAELNVNTINAGIYVLEPDILDIIATDVNRSFEYDVFPDILGRGLPFYGYTIKDDYWRDIGTPASYLAAHQDFLDGRIAVPTLDDEDDTEIATRAEIDRLSVIGKDCIVKPGVKIVRSVIGPGVHIEERSVIENSVIWPHTRISGAAEIRGAVIGRSCHIGRNVIVGEGSVLGDKTTLTDYTKV